VAYAKAKLKPSSPSDHYDSKRVRQCFNYRYLSSYRQRC